MSAPLSWLRDAYERRDALRAEGVHLQISVTTWGITIWSEGMTHEVSRAWSALDGASINPLIPSMDTVAARVRRERKAA